MVLRENSSLIKHKLLRYILMQMNHNRYLKLQKIGEGAYAVVYKALDSETNQTVALKKFKFDPHVEGVTVTALREISILQTLNHPNIVKVRDQVIQNSKLHLVLDHYPLSLLDHLNTKPTLDFLKVVASLHFAQSFCAQILSALTYLEDRKLIHRDLSPANIMLTPSHLAPVLVDFGTSRPSNSKQFTPGVTTLWYRAPELLEPGDSQSCAVDIWSLGCILAEIVLGKPLFPASSESELQSLQVQIEEGSIWQELAGAALEKGVEKEFVDLVQGLLRLKGENRLSASKALNHPYFQTVIQ